MKLTTKINGWSFRIADEPRLKTAKIVVGDKVLLVKKTVEYTDRDGHPCKDEHAVWVYWKNVHIGFMPADKNRSLIGESTEAVISLVKPMSNDGKLGGVPVKKGENSSIHIEINIKDESATEHIVLKKLVSFNENVEFMMDEENHKYYRNNKRATSPSREAKKYKEPFDSKQASFYSEKAYGVAAEIFKKGWRSTGIMSSSIGTDIHYALEHYYIFEKYSDRIDAVIRDKNMKQKDPKKIIPIKEFKFSKNKLLKRIVKEFLKIDKYKGKVVPEAFISDKKNNICGLVDKLLITGDKKCRIQDYKIIENEMVDDKYEKKLGRYSHLPKTKIATYSLQLSYYAKMMINSGWEVEGLDIIVYSDESWKWYEVEYQSDIY